MKQLYSCYFRVDINSSTSVHCSNLKYWVSFWVSFSAPSFHGLRLASIRTVWWGEVWSACILQCLHRYKRCWCRATDFERFKSCMVRRALTVIVQVLRGLREKQHGIGSKFIAVTPGHPSCYKPFVIWITWSVFSCFCLPEFRVFRGLPTQSIGKTGWHCSEFCHFRTSLKIRESFFSKVQ